MNKTISPKMLKYERRQADSRRKLRFRSRKGVEDLSCFCGFSPKKRSQLLLLGTTATPVDIHSFWSEGLKARVWNHHSHPSRKVEWGNQKKETQKGRPPHSMYTLSPCGWGTREHMENKITVLTWAADQNTFFLFVCFGNPTQIKMLMLFWGI